MRLKHLWTLFLFGYVYASQFDVLVIGDDVSAYHQTTSNWVKLVKEKTSCPLQIYNASRPGATSQDGYRALYQFLKKHKSKIVIIELGTNDVSQKQKFSDIEKNLDSMFQLVEEYGGEVILMGVELPPNYGTIYRQLFKSTFQRTAKKHNAQLVFTEFTTDPNLVQIDQLHPNDEGHQSISDSIFPLIDSIACP